MSTRLDRLFLLLDTGSTPLIRKSAAEQLGEVQKLHPYELNNLITKVHQYLCSTNWETRIAAGLAVEAIAKNVPQWQPRGAPKSEPGAVVSVHCAGRILFSQFDVNKVLAFGASLLASEGGQYDVDHTTCGTSLDKERLSKQRQLLNKRLGLDLAGNLGIDTGNLFNDDDLQLSTSNSNGNIGNAKPVTDFVRQQLLSVTCGMSARERNRAKRKARHFAKQISKDAQSENSLPDVEPPSKKLKSGTHVGDETLEDKVFDQTDTFLNIEEMDEWPFESFCELLMNDLFNNAWEVRHGAATGLRDVIKLHGRSAGMASDTPSDQLLSINQIWLSDLSLRLLCVLALDRFGDFVSDEVVAPVRETCAQTLGVILKYLDSDGVHGVLGVLLQLLSQQRWEVRHGGLLSLKYLLAVRRDLTDKLLPLVLPAVFTGLQDPDDDVRAVAAAALVPVTDSFVKLMPQQTPIVISCLWETLLDLDDLTASTNSIMTLLATLLAHPGITAGRLFTAHLAHPDLTSGSVSQSLSELVPRLWPFLRHNIKSVRKAALQTFYTLLSAGGQQNVLGSWLPLVLQDALRHIYQRSLLEHNADLLQLVEKVWAELLDKTPLDYLIGASIPWLGVWLCLLMQPARIPYEPSYLIEAKHRVRDNSTSKSHHPSESTVMKEQRDYIGGISVNANLSDHDSSVMKARITGARLLGRLASYITRPLPNFPPEAEKPAISLAKLFVFHLNTKSALQRYIVGQVTYQWAVQSQPCECPEELKTKLLECLNDAIYFDEIAVSFTRMQSDCQDFIASLKSQGIDMDSRFPPGILTLDQAAQLSTVYNEVKGNFKPRVVSTLEERCRQLQTSVSSTSQEQQMWTVRVLTSLSMAVVMMNVLPDKFNPVIRPLMECIKKEPNQEIQNEASKCLAILIERCIDRNPNPSCKVITNICGFLCCDPSSTPSISQPTVPKNTEQQPHEVTCDKHNGIMTLMIQQRTSEQNRRFIRRNLSIKGDTDISDDVVQENAEVSHQLRTQRLGAEAALSTICRHFGDSLPHKAPTLWEMCLRPLKQVQTDSSKDESEENAQNVVTSLHVLEATLPALHEKLRLQIVDMLSALQTYVSHSFTAVRHMAARCFAALTQHQTLHLMHFVIEDILPMLGAAHSDKHRQGATEVLADVIDLLAMDLVPYIVLLVVPILGRMSDHNEAVRLMATQCFATLIRLMPLEAGIPDPPEMKISLVEQKIRERQFLEQLLDGSKLKDYKVAVPISAELRKYQHDGVNWLAFLNKYQLHGILCDDMGLGKTLQSICILASDHFINNAATQNPVSAPHLSIVVCPPTLVGHWVYEIQKFVDKKFLNPLMYVGPPGERQRLQKKVEQHNLIVASYDVVRNDIEFFSNITWNYCILDEGHIIRNGKTKLSKAVKQLTCKHRLILSGTPIQNNVLDLWSLFDFLMPGFLGTERQFQSRYGKPILQSRDAKSTSKEQEAGALAMESLHRQVLPFILRRLKEDVLQDLPPKIIQDYYCDLSPLQTELYEDFARSRAKQGVEETLSDDGKEKKTNTQGTTHIFQALQYLRKVCNHPSLVLNANHPKYEEITAQLKQQNSSLHDLTHAPKLTALKQLLQDCGIGVNGTSGSGQLGTEIPVVNQHRVLLFCQLKTLLDIVEHDLLKTHMPTVTYLRLDGSVPAGSRHDIVHRFNNDPSIDILLLTTHVGGLGLNLTGADTVVFVEHDWNPMKDLQAMDRAHRIGQKKVVNVYRLVTRGTLEEKIMGLQKFKMTIANTVITQDNSSLQSMGTDQLLDLFTLDDRKKGESSVPEHMGDVNSKKDSIKTILEKLGNLWDEKQYENEYNLDNFMKSLE